VGKRPYAIAISAERNAAYVVSFGDGAITAVDFSTGVLAPPVLVGKRPWVIALIA
jgi:DNA-binding beta-propeller fold protein YncE